MKRIITIISAAVMLAACSKKELELNPFNQIETSQAFNTETDVNLAILGIYQGMRANFYVNSTWNVIGDVLADNVIISSLGRQTLTTFGDWRYNGDQTIALFAQGYSITRRANAVLENIDKFPAGPFKDNARGEALATRAFIYFDMARVFSKTFENATTADSTMAYITSTDAKQMPVKESLRGFYQKIVRDLTSALPLISSNNGVGRLNKSAVSGLLSRLYLYMGDFTNCISSSNAALGTTPVLPTRTEFPSVWADLTNNGVLFKISNTTLDNINTPGVNYYQTIGGLIRSEYVCDFTLRQLYEASDIRTSTYIQTSLWNGVLQNHIIKYAGRPGQVAGVVDAKVLRTAEVLLNRAEAYQRSGNDALALADLNLLRANRYSPYVPLTLSGSALLAEILKERRLELAFEGDRFWDLKRRNQPVLRNATTGDRADGTGVRFIFTTLAANDHRFQLPFPSSEINFNPGFKQNPGY